MIRLGPAPSVRPAAALAALFVALAGCADTGAYPVSAEPCGPNDPVREIRAGECIPPS